MKTKQDYDYFRNYILNAIDFSDEEIDEIIPFTEIKEFKRDDQLMQCNHLCDEVFFMIHGSVRYSILNHKKDNVIFNFRFENNFVTAYSVYYNNIAKFDVTCIEDCKVLTIPIQSIFELAKKSYKLEMFKFLLTKNHLVELVNYVTDSLSKSVIARYNDLELAFPNINQRIPQYMIANYLGVSQEHLSRLKSSRNSLKK